MLEHLLFDEWREVVSFGVVLTVCAEESDGHAVRCIIVQSDVVNFLGAWSTAIWK